MKKAINGVFLLNKAHDISSNHALQQIKRLFNAQKAGHTGTLDPLATGLLPICFGEATKFAQYLIDADKTYLATLKFGQATTTGDKEGEIILTSDVAFSEKDLKLHTQQFIGCIQQTPPMFSALKHDGIPLYQYARKGINIERKSREIEIFAIDIVNFDFPYATLKIHCSKGTYIRTLAEDLAKSMDSFAYLENLARMKTNHFDIKNAYPFNEIQNYSEPELESLLLPIDTLISHFDKIKLNSLQEKQIKNGQLVQYSLNYEIMTSLSLYSMDDDFIGLGVYDPQLMAIKALRLMNTNAS
ncbi:tRNA pseudouridine(55) synthase TruB [Neisseriaceae bacterium PsAf]|nr:tRNA pseudouridine(55) synthase TruB [Neisseriaceae bacterium PsAf]